MSSSRELPPSASGIHTWMSDGRHQSVRKITADGREWNVKATPEAPGKSGYILTCLELPGWSGRAGYAFPDERDNCVFQFIMQTRDIRAAMAPADTADR